MSKRFGDARPSSGSKQTRKISFAALGAALSLAILVGGLTVRPAAAGTTGGEARKLPALPSSAPPEERQVTPKGDFHDPPVGGRSEAKPQFTGFDNDRSTVVSRSEDRTTFRNPDGSRTTRVFTGPVNYKDAAGAWRPIDTTVVPDSSGGYRNAAGPVRYHFGDATGSSDVVTAAAADDTWSLGFALDGASSGRPATTQGSDGQSDVPGILPTSLVGRPSGLLTEWPARVALVLRRRVAENSKEKLTRSWATDTTRSVWRNTRNGVRDTGGRSTFVESCTAS